MRNQMKDLLNKAALTAAATAACVGTANAVVLTFEDPANTALAPFLLRGEVFSLNGIQFEPWSSRPEAQNGDLVGAILDGQDLVDTCAALNCPSNNPTKFYAGLNDGQVFVSSGNANAPILVRGFDAAFIGAQGESLPAVAGLLQVVGFNAAGTALANLNFQLRGPNSAGALSFASYVPSAAFAATPFAFIRISSFVCNDAGSCAANSTARGQWAIDNLNVAVVPEPTQWALFGLGLAGVAAVVRRRRA